MQAFAQVFDSGLVRATAGLKGVDKLDAVLRFVFEANQR